MKVRLTWIVMLFPLLGWGQQFPDQLVVGVPNDSLVPGSCNSNYIIYYVQPDNPPTLWGCSNSSNTYVKLTGTSSGGTVTSVAVASVPSWMTSSVATPTTTPSITLSTASGQTANQVLATPNGSSGSVGLRALVAADLPSSAIVTAAPPYISIGGTKYVAASGFQATLPGTPTWINSVAPGTVTVTANGSVFISGTTAYAVSNATTSVEGEFICQTVGANSFSGCNIWIYDSTNSFLYTFGVGVGSSGAGNGQLTASKFTWSGGAANPVFSANVGTAYNIISMQPYHLQLIVSGGTLSMNYSLDGGNTFQSSGFTVTGVGTITKGGYGIANTAAMSMYSLVLH